MKIIEAFNVKQPMSDRTVYFGRNIDIWVVIHYLLNIIHKLLTSEKSQKLARLVMTISKHDQDFSSLFRKSLSPIFLVKLTQNCIITSGQNKKINRKRIPLKKQ